MPSRRQRCRALAPAVELLEHRTLLSAVVALGREAMRSSIEVLQHGGLSPSSTAAPTGISPVQMRRAYGIDSIKFGSLVGDGTGQTIAIIDAYDNPNAASDLHNFDLAFGLPDPPSFTKLNEDGGTALPITDPSPLSDHWAIETSLDIQWAHVVAPRASIVVYEAGSDTLNDLVAHAVDAARHNPSVSVISMSFGGDEFAGENSFDGYFTTSADRSTGGVTFVASSGDGGSPGLYPAASPNVLGIGGTIVNVDAAGTYLGEVGWSGSGGGISSQEPQPTYQAVVQGTGSRSVPDVSMDAAAAVPVYDTFDNPADAPWVGAAGTSLSAPMWAGLVALADQGRLSNSLATLDGPSQTLPQLYQMPSGAFHDIATGSNGGFAASPGYDLVTGLGTPVANLLIPSLGGTPVVPAAATFVAADTATGGTWTGSYGADGYWDFNGASALPSYAQITPAGQSSWTWNASTADPRAPQTSPGSTDRIAATMFSANSFTLDLNLTDGQPHEVALYMLDWDSSSRAQNVMVNDVWTGAVLDTQSVSGFHNGQWLVWDLTGHVTITITNTGGLNAVASAIMFGGPSQPPPPPPPPPPPAGSSVSFVASDVSTQGTWSGVYGGDGYWDFNGASALPGYAQVTPSGQQTWTWNGSTSDPRALQAAPGSSSRLAACMFSDSSFTLDINLTDANAHPVALYMDDWDAGNTRAQTVQVKDADTGTVLDARTVTHFGNGQWLVWNISGHVQITLANNGGLNAVASGIMFGGAGTVQPPPPPPPPTSSAAFVTADTTTEGSWTGVYGGDGFWDFNGTNALPSYATITPEGQQNWTWAASTTDLRALQTSPGSSDRLSACLFSGGPGSSFTLDVNLADGNPHEVALYMLDWDSATRAQSVQLTDAAGGAVLDTRSAAGFHDGQWLVWTATGHFKITVTCTGGLNAVVGGIMFGGASAVTPPPPTQPPPASSGAIAFLGNDTVTQGTWGGSYGADGYWVFNGTNALPGYASVTPTGQSAWTWNDATSDPRALQVDATSASRIASCFFAADSFTLDVNLTDGNTHQVALYMDDWDGSNTREQVVKVTDASTGAVLDARSVSSFGGGQWLVWNVTGHVKITLINVGGLNALATGIMFGPAI